MKIKGTPKVFEHKRDRHSHRGSHRHSDRHSDRRSR